MLRCKASGAERPDPEVRSVINRVGATGTAPPLRTRFRMKAEERARGRVGGHYRAEERRMLASGEKVEAPDVDDYVADDERGPVLYEFMKGRGDRVRLVARGER